MVAVSTVPVGLTMTPPSGTPPRYTALFEAKFFPSTNSTVCVALAAAACISTCDGGCASAGTATNVKSRHAIVWRVADQGEKRMENPPKNGSNRLTVVDWRGGLYQQGRPRPQALGLRRQGCLRPQDYYSPGA